MMFIVTSIMRQLFGVAIVRTMSTKHMDSGILFQATKETQRRRIKSRPGNLWVKRKALDGPWKYLAKLIIVAA
jgi:hypothetical protein